MDCSVQPNGLREVEEVRTTIFAFTRDVDSPRALRRRPSSPTLQKTMDIPPCINLIRSGKESSAFQAAWRQSLKAAAFAVRGCASVDKEVSAPPYLCQRQRLRRFWFSDGFDGVVIVPLRRIARICGGGGRFRGGGSNRPPFKIPSRRRHCIVLGNGSVREQDQGVRS